MQALGKIMGAWKMFRYKKGDKVWINIKKLSCRGVRGMS